MLVSNIIMHISVEPIIYSSGLLASVCWALFIKLLCRCCCLYDVTSSFNWTENNESDNFIENALIKYFPSSILELMMATGVFKILLTCHVRDYDISAVTRIRTWVVSATTRSTNHYTITAITPA